MKEEQMSEAIEPVRGWGDEVTVPALLQAAVELCLDELADADAAITAAIEHRDRAHARLKAVTEAGRRYADPDSTSPVPVTATWQSSNVVPIVRPPSPAMPVEPVELPTIPPAQERPTARTPRRRGRGSEMPPLEEIAAVYLAAYTAGKKPITALCDHFDVERSTAKNWPAKCRAAGLLAPRNEPPVHVDAPYGPVRHRQGARSD